MKKMTTSQKGFTHLVLVLLAVVILAVGFAAYKVTKSNQDKTQPVSSTPNAANSSNPPAIQSSTDLDSATSSLNAQPVDSDLNPDQLDNDVNSLY